MFKRFFFFALKKKEKDNFYIIEGAKRNILAGSQNSQRHVEIMLNM